MQKYQINKGDVSALIIEADDIKTHYEAKEKPSSRYKKKCPNNYLPKDWAKRWKSYFEKKKTSRRQTGGFLNRYDFAYAGRDVVNQVGKVAPKLLTGNWRNKQNCSAEN